VSYVFGPVPSRRLGLSLGVDLVPLKTCSYDCLYCQVGRTTCLIAEPASLVPMGEVMRQLKQSLERVTPDVVTFSGSGEPTLHSGIGEAVALVKRVEGSESGCFDQRVPALEGGGPGRTSGCDVIMPTLTTVNEDTYRKIHRPHPELHLARVIQGIGSLRKDYRGELDVEVVLHGRSQRQ
jgi:wyosine [tRNA(Phe)-imidazoG37] synthetase (radical SAM superfamily)